MSEQVRGTVAPKEPMPITVYTPASALRDPGLMFRSMIADLRASRELAWSLARRDIKAQYRQSLLGYLWAFIMPLSTTAAWVYLNASGIVKVTTTGMAYPVYVLTGTMLWQMFTEALQTPLGQLGASKNLLAKLSFPREALILSGFIKWSFNAGVKLLIIIPALFLLGDAPNAQILLVPIILLAILLIGTSIGLFIAPIGLLYTDIGRLIPVVLQFAMYITPVVFAMPSEGFAATLFRINFMTPVIVTGRAWLVGTEGAMLPELAVVCGGALVLLLLGWVLFRSTMSVLIERMSA
ncbi:MAG: ABC transporter permease [Flavobacteriales bacterium]|nr:ABC transporter permease [Flavobacteriales bacterium]